METDARYDRVAFISEQIEAKHYDEAISRKYALGVQWSQEETRLRECPNKPFDSDTARFERYKAAVRLQRPQAQEPEHITEREYN